jgi:hypothetical protein
VSASARALESNTGKSAQISAGKGTVFRWYVFTHSNYGFLLLLTFWFVSFCSLRDNDDVLIHHRRSLALALVPDLQYSLDDLMRLACCPENQITSAVLFN